MTVIDLDRLKTLGGVDVAGKRILVRADLNVPVQDGRVSDATRLERLLPGLRDLTKRGAKVIVVSHFGRPKNGPDPALSLRIVAHALAELVGCHSPVTFVPDCIGAETEAAVAALSLGQIAVLENLRFHKGEEQNDPAFTRALAKLADFYVNDAFSCAHRSHTSTEGLAHVLPAFAGPLLMEEILALRAALEEPKRPTAAVVGGAKVSSKIPVLENLVAKVDMLIVGGGMANTFLFANGHGIGRSLCEPDYVATVKLIEKRAHESGCRIVLPVDGVVTTTFKAGAPSQTVSISDIPTDTMMLDVGPQTIALLSTLLAQCRTLLWNGPLGAFETTPFDTGTVALAREAARLTTDGQLISVAGGGDTVAALNAAHVADQFTYVSTAGGAFLEWLEGRTLPGVAALAGSGVMAG